MQVVHKCRHGNAINMDLGLASLAVTSDGEKIAPPKFPCSALKRFGWLQPRLSHKLKGSSNRTTAWLKLAKAHAAVNDQRSMSAMRRLRH
ncbi:MAG: transposase [Synechococcus sp. SB0662_bin_45]|nr:transposase [Synechococcus sp. SB0668_bin_13]MXY18612.1 transposase [Synechococcus sp. SB0664_bin_36]MYE21564.1 transposase [Synechococcus sp. SB0662_bin_45]MYK06493.1 transposase [Synechococcus sp. SB0670_bin_20]